MKLPPVKILYLTDLVAVVVGIVWLFIVVAVVAYLLGDRPWLRVWSPTLDAPRANDCGLATLPPALTLGVPYARSE